jgi:hypothetical protein
MYNTLPVDVKHIEDIYSYVGFIPTGYDLIEYELDTDPLNGTVLYGFDEIGLSQVANPVHAFVKLAVA